MHEQGMMVSLLRQVEMIAAREHATVVERVCVRIGGLANMSEDHFQFHWDQVKGGSIAEHATLEVILSTDLTDPNAQGVTIVEIDVEQT